MNFIPMNYLQTGTYFGNTNRKIQFNGITLTDTEYTHEYVDWHYHENAYFTFILQGQVIEGNKKESLHCPAGTLLFHYWHDPHYNIKPKGYTRGFHVEIERSWFQQFELKEKQGSFKIQEPLVKLFFHQLLKESFIKDDAQDLSISINLINALSAVFATNDGVEEKKPAWIKKAKEIIHSDQLSNLTLSNLAKELNIHPVHLCRQFQKYFNCGFGEYIRKLRVEKSLILLLNKEMPMTKISFDCCFADQRHFIRCFKEVTKQTPLQYRKVLGA